MEYGIKNQASPADAPPHLPLLVACKTLVQLRVFAQNHRLNFKDVVRIQHLEDAYGRRKDRPIHLLPCWCEGTESGAIQRLEQYGWKVVHVTEEQVLDGSFPLRSYLPFRVQRRRSKGWRMPENTVSVCRPGKWGNPFVIGRYFKVGGEATRLGRFQWMERCIWKPDDIQDALATGFVLVENHGQAVDIFERLMKASPWKFEELRGKNLACWCKRGTPCHADTILRLANA